MTLEGVEIVKAEELPLKTRNAVGVFSGLVEIRYERNSPLTSVVKPIKGTFAQRYKEIAEKE